MSTISALQPLIVLGASETLELKRSAAERRRASETLCAFLKGEGRPGAVRRIAGRQDRARASGERKNAVR